MARGWESKSVEAQQLEAESRPAPDDEESSEVDPALASRRRKLELARFDFLHRLDAAHAENHREMLRRALAAVDEEIAKLDLR
jgi:hypothetical protein